MRATHKTQQRLPLTGLLVTLAVVLSAATLMSQPSAPPYLSGIIQLLEEGNLTDAELQLKGLLNRFNDPVAHDLLGIVYFQSERYDEAEREFLRAVALAPNMLPPRRNLINLYQVTNREAEAIPHLRAAIKLSPEDRNLPLLLASIERRLGHTDSADQQLQSLATDFKSVKSLLKLVQLRIAEDDTDAALNYLDQARQLAPNSEEILSTYARIYLRLHSPMPAIMVLEPLVRMHPKEPDYSYLLGVARMQLADLSGAAEVLVQSLQLAPDRPLTLIAYGLVLNKQNEFIKAEEALEHAIELVPDNLEAIAAMAEAKVGLDELDTGMKFAQRVLASQPTHTTANLAMGVALMKKKQWSDAVTYLEAVSKADPDEAKAHYQLSLAYARLGDREHSKAERLLFQQAQDNVEENLAELQRRTGRGGKGGMGH